MTDVSAAAVKARAAEQLSGATSEMVTQGNIEVRLCLVTALTRVTGRGYSSCVLCMRFPLVLRLKFG